MKDELKALYETRIAWFLAGAFLTHGNLDAIVTAVKVFAGV